MKKETQKSSLKEVEGVTQPHFMSPKMALQIKNLRTKSIDSKALVSLLLTGNITALSQGITFIESKQQKHNSIANDIINSCLPHANKSIRIGITGVPGVGKSTFIESFGKHLTTLGKKVAVLAVDPSSSISHGSILGDKTRMEELVKDPNAFIRPSASGDSLGGVARKTREAIVLCEAAGFNVIIIETVGVGQSETAVHSMVDFFLLLKIAGAGDELQGIKRGIMEMADAIVINKADGDNIKKASLARVEFKRALHLFPPKKSGWIPEVTTCSAITHDGIDAVWEIISNYEKHAKETAYFVNKRKEQNEFWMMETIQQHLKQHFYEDETISKKVITEKEAVNKGEKSPFTAAMELLDFYFKA